MSRASYLASAARLPTDALPALASALGREIRTADDLTRIIAEAAPDDLDSIGEAMSIAVASLSGTALYRMRYIAHPTGAHPVEPLTFRLNFPRRYDVGRDYIVPEDVVSSAHLAAAHVNRKGRQNGSIFAEPFNAPAPTPPAITRRDP